MSILIPIHSLEKLSMWHKVKELFSDGLNKSQISELLSIDRGRVRRYLLMDLDSFLSSQSMNREYTCKLDTYRDYIVSRLKKYPFLSSSQIHDNLKSKYQDSLPIVNSKTVYNYVEKIRLEDGIPKPKGGVREFNKQEETDYGLYAEVDFGEQLIYDVLDHPQKIYFFAIILARSRQKFIYLQDKPFTTQATIYAHELAFDFFGGIPGNIIYDQDRVLIQSENFGNYCLTQAFSSFVSQQNFTPVFCRKSDPQSKGKVENLVKYVKYNFLRGFDYTDINNLNKEAILWLERTANGIAHTSTKLVPASEFKQEQSYLKPYTGVPKLIEEIFKPYTVRKDNTISYKGNYYSVPSGTYQKQQQMVKVNILDHDIEIFDVNSGKLIAKHIICNHKGKYVSKIEHRPDRTIGLNELETKITDYISDSQDVKRYLQYIKTNQVRYYRDSLKFLIRYMNDYSSEELIYGVQKMLVVGDYSPKSLLSYLNNQIESPNNLDNDPSQICNYHGSKYTPSKRKLSTYENLI